MLVMLVGVTVIAAPGRDGADVETAAGVTPTAATAAQEDTVASLAEPTPTSTPELPDPTNTPTPELPEPESDVLKPAPSPTAPQPVDPTATAMATRTIEAPIGLSIPAINVNATVERVGLDAVGNMDVPSGYESVAWYEKGAKPGATGNSVIAGHLDSRNGPAVFYRLSDLAPGDEIIVTTHDGEELRFVVDRVATFDTETAPRYEVFGPSSSANLNLITCEGTFDSAAGAYDERLVVYSTLVT